MIGKKFLALSLSAAILAGSAMSASAAGLSDVFDATTYAGKYSDLKAVYGTDAAKLIEHFKAFGAKEGRTISPILDVVAYRNAYADLNAAFGDNWDAYVDHYLTTGIKEKRTAGVMFDLVDYANKNADIKAAYGTDYVAIAKHYVTLGIRENRPGGTIAQAAPAASASSSTSAPSTSTPSTNTPSTSTPSTNTPSTSKPNNSASVDEDKVITDTATHVHIIGDLNDNGFRGDMPTLDAAGNVLDLNDAVSYLAPTCYSEGYVVWRCDQPVLVNQYDAKGNFIGTVPVVDENGDPILCNTEWRQTLAKEHVAPTVNENIHWVHPTCISTGVMSYVCERCGEYVKVELDKLEHHYDYTGVYVESKSCVPGDEGYDRWQCRNCGLIDDRTRPLLNHQLGAARIVDQEATCTSTGLAHGYCDYCAKEVEEIIPVTGHVNATHKVDGVTTDLFTVYADAYKIEAAAANPNAPRMHVEYQVKYCKNCSTITWVDPSVSEADAVNCTDNNVQANGTHGDGACDACQLQMNRTGKNQIKFYQEGQKYYGTVQ